MAETNTDIVAAPHEDGSQVKLRSYQEEMLEASLKRNVIIAMDTGSGKTHVAVYRIRAELERSGPSKLIWFMSPSVALSEQQHKVLAENLPGYQVKSLLGRDGVDKWSDQRLWDAVLTNVRVVVGTPAVLEQALTHGFVQLSRLSLLVFDEAHRCIGAGPMNTIMTNFYHAAKRRGEYIPHILGLTASPVMSAKPASLATIESNIDAIAITPKLYRDELEAYVHPPQIVRVLYDAIADGSRGAMTELHRALSNAVAHYDFTADPWILELQSYGDDRSLRALQKQLAKPKTFCSEQLRALEQRSEALLKQLGTAAADWYVRTCIDRFIARVDVDAQILAEISELERKHLASILVACSTPDREDSHLRPERQQEEPQTVQFNEKVQLLVDALIQHHLPSTRAIIFVEQRAAVHALAHILRQHAEVRSRYAIGTFVGSSGLYNKTPVAELAASKEQQQHLDGFRDGEVNLMVATNVLEEGIDVPQCNLVICFDLPTNLVSFVQRRGRARQNDSKYIMFLLKGDTTADPKRWQILEDQMKEAYMDDTRPPPDSAMTEDTDMNSMYRIESTGALLTMENAKPHLLHFCVVSSLHGSQYVDVRPTSTITGLGNDDTDMTDASPKGPFTAQVNLPSFVHPSHRSASSNKAWSSEDTAIKDAAFQAYVALHKAGLVNDNLLPLTKDYGPDEGDIHLDQPSILEVSERIQFWRTIAADAQCYEDMMWHAGRLTLSLDVRCILDITIWLPCPVSPFKLPLYWNESMTYHAELKPAGLILAPSPSEQMDHLRTFTRILLQSVHVGRMQSDVHDFFILFSSSEYSREAQACTMGGSQAANVCFQHAPDLPEYGLIRIRGEAGRAYFYAGLPDIRESPGDNNEPHILGITFPKRRNFLRPVVGRNARNSAYTAIVRMPMERCTFDNLPSRYALLAAFLPSILHRLDLASLARNLHTTVLNKVNFGDLSLVVQALSAPSAGEALDYNRLEYLGDAVLKFCAVLQTISKHPTWPEGYLHRDKDRIVNNKHLARAALAAGLAKYVLTEPFTGQRWRPPYFSDFSNDHSTSTRQMSSKVLADVVEALIGAAYLEGGLPNSFQCVKTVLPEESWVLPGTCIVELRNAATTVQRSDLTLLQRLIDYDFVNPALLVEAITHASLPDNRTGLSYERLEFLGDAVLDLIITPKLYGHHRQLRHWDLHRVHQALVNGRFLAFCCISYYVEEGQCHVQSRGIGKEASFEVKESARQVHLHDFLRASVELSRARRQALNRFDALRSSIGRDIELGDQYPWADLIAMQPPKFVSDVVESVLGAMYIDSQGDLSVCEAFLERLGILSYMRRILDERIETAFPKEQLGLLADSNTVKYCTVRQDDVGGKRIFVCTVMVGEDVVAKATDCSTKEEAEVRAASQAVITLRAKAVGTTKPDQLRKRKLESMDHETRAVSQPEREPAGMDID